MMLTARQADATSELLNIAFARTALALSQLTGYRVALQAPEVTVVPLSELPRTLDRYIPGDVATIHQGFSGPLAGDALLILNHSGAVELSALLSDVAIPSATLDESAREVLTEVGNILLNACLSLVGDALHVRVNFAVPRLHLEDLRELVASLPHIATDDCHAIVVSMAFRVNGSKVTGYLALVLGVTSLEKLLIEIEAWEARGTLAS
jgi:chemotaxis protein CheC